MRSLVIKNSNSKKSHLVIIFIIIIFCALGLFSSPHLDSDEGVVLNVAWRFWNGSRDIYTSKFIEYIAPGSGLSVFVFWKLLGQPNIIIAKLLAYLFWVIGSLGIYLIVSKYTKKLKLILLPIILWLLIIGYYSQINHNSFSSDFSIWLIYLVLVLNDDKKKTNIILLVALGAINSLVFWFLQTKGLIFFIFITTFLLFEKNIKKFILIYLGSFVLLLLLLLNITGIKKTIVALFVLPFTTNYITTNHSQLMLPTILLAPTIFFLMFCISIHDRRKDYFILAIFQLGLFISTSNNFNLPHFLINLFPAIIFYIVYFSDNYSKFQPKFGKINSTLLITSIGFILILSIRNFLGPNILNTKIISELNTPEIARAKNIYAGPFLPGIYYEARKTTFFPLSHVDVSNDLYQNEMTESIKTIKPEIAFIDYSIVKRLHYNIDNPIDNYIKSNYQLCAKKILGKTTSVFVLDTGFCPK